MTATPAPLYKIANWHALYEVRESHRTSGPMKWIPVVTKTDGLGFGLLRQNKNAVKLLAAWYLLLGIAAKQDKESRGFIARDGVALTADDLELMTGFPVEIFTLAFEFFTQSKQGWLVTASCAESAQLARLSCEKAPTGQDSTGQNRTGQDKTAEQNAAGAAPAVVAGAGLVFTTDEAERIVAAEAKAKRDAAELLAAQRAAAEAAHAAAEAEAARLKSAADADWLDGLKRNPAYEGIDVMREHAKAAVWCENKRRTLSRARFINWLNRAERPMAGRSTMR
jgi:hypothetical protein